MVLPRENFSKSYMTSDTSPVSSSPTNSITESHNFHRNQKKSFFASLAKTMFGLHAAITDKFTRLVKRVQYTEVNSLIAKANAVGQQNLNKACFIPSFNPYTYEPIALNQNLQKQKKALESKLIALTKVNKNVDLVTADLTKIINADSLDSLKNSIDNLKDVKSFHSYDFDASVLILSRDLQAAWEKGEDLFIISPSFKPDLIVEGIKKAHFTKIQSFLDQQEMFSSINKNT